jgi:hypothetical protein
MDQNKKMDGIDIGRIRMVLMFDEAKTLVDFDFFNAFRWIFDMVIEKAWRLTQNERPDQLWTALPFMAIFLGTNSKVAQFLPPDEESSARYYFSEMAIPPPFTALEWDTNISQPFTSLSYDKLPGMSWLSRFGRPMWQARWSVSSNKTPQQKLEDAESIIEFAEKKLHHLHEIGGFRLLFIDNHTKKPSDFLLSCAAIVGVLAVLDMDFTSPTRAAELVASRLRWAAGCDKKRSYLLTTYASEPILAEAAFRLLFTAPSKAMPDKVLVAVLEQISAQITNGDYDVGSDGELAARIVCKRPSGIH